MKRTITKLPVGDTQKRVRVTIQTDECLEGSLCSKQLLSELLSNIADQPDIVACELTPFQTLKIFFDGSHWVAEAEALVSNP